jgi:MHS family proline/betaine transporter-like MFS transporter
MALHVLLGLLSSLLGWFIFNNLEESPFFKEQQKRKAAGTITATQSPVKTVVFAPLSQRVVAQPLDYVRRRRGLLPDFRLSAVLSQGGERRSQQHLVADPDGCERGGAGVGGIVRRHQRRSSAARRRFFWSGSACWCCCRSAISVWPRPPTPPTITLYALAIAFLGNAGYAPILIFLNERFPTEIRASGTGLSWNIGFALGGMMPTFVSLASAGPAQIPMSLSVFVAVIFVIYLIGALLIPETKGDFR